METKVNQYDIYLKGIFGRNRKEKFEIFKLIDKPAEDAPLTEAEVDALVETALKTIKVKSSTKLSVHVNKITYTKENGFTTKTFGLMSAKLVKRYQ